MFFNKHTVIKAVKVHTNYLPFRERIVHQPILTTTHYALLWLGSLDTTMLLFRATMKSTSRIWCICFSFPASLNNCWGGKPEVSCASQKNFELPSLLFFGKFFGALLRISLWNLTLSVEFFADCLHCDAETTRHYQLVSLLLQEKYTTVESRVPVQAPAAFDTGQPWPVLLWLGSIPLLPVSSRNSTPSARRMNPKWRNSKICSRMA